MFSFVSSIDFYIIYRIEIVDTSLTIHALSEQPPKHERTMWKARVSLWWTLNVYHTMKLKIVHSNLQYLSLNLINSLSVVCGQKASACVNFDSRERVVCPDLIIFWYNLRFLIWLVTLLVIVIIVLALVHASQNMSRNSLKHMSLFYSREIG